MHVISSDIEVKSDAKSVWEIIKDFGSYEQWNPYITRCSGDLRPTARLDMIVKPDGGNASAEKGTILAVSSPARTEPPFELRWMSSAVLGLLQREFSIHVDSTGENATQVTQKASFSGPLARFKQAEIKSTEISLHAVNAALAEAAEKAAA